jgi:hypothetical protein
MNESYTAERDLPFWRFLLARYRELSSPPVLVVVCLAFYLPLGWILAFHSELLDHPVHPWDLYFGFDTPSYVHRMIALGFSGGANANHPLLKFLFLPLAGCGELLRQAGLEKWRTFLYAGSMALLVTGSVLNVAVYCRSVLRLSKLRANLLALTLACSFTALTLSFTPESYPVSMYVLSLSILYLSREISAGRPFRLRSVVFWSALAGGVTISNAVKPLLSAAVAPAPERKNLKTALRAGLAVGAIFLVVLSLSYSLRNLLWHSDASFIVDLLGRASSNVAPIPVLGAEWIKSVASLFCGGPWYAPSARIAADAAPMSIFLVPYASWPLYLVPVILLVVVAAGCLPNRRDPHVHLLLAFLVPDIVIHVLLGWGSAEATMYAAHWIVPSILLVAWACRPSAFPRREMAIDGVLAANLLVMTAFNLQALFTLVSFATRYYPPR